MLGILLIDKHYGCTSHDVVNSVRRIFSTRRVGHAGTLDPLATGLLVVAVGPATRFLQYLPLEPKEYVGEITFGRATSTYDLEGETTNEGAVPTDLAATIDQALPHFMGLIEQLPPMYSAVKIDGKPLYHHARSGKHIDREPRTVHIDTFEVEQLSETTVRARIICSGGTYIRSLAHDLGEALGCGAHLSKLHRTGVGKFRVEMAKPLSEVTSDDLIPLSSALPPMPLVQLNDHQVEQVREGRQIGVSEIPTHHLVGLMEGSGEVFSVARVHGHLLQPECVIPREALYGAV